MVSGVRVKGQVDRGQGAELKKVYYRMIMQSKLIMLLFLFEETGKSVRCESLLS